MKKFSEMTKKTTVTGEDYVPIIDSTAPTIEEKNKAALLSTIKSFVEDGFTAGNPKLVFGVGSNSDPTGYPRVEFRKSGDGSTQGVSFVYYDANGNATFNDFIRSDGTFIPSKVDKAGDTMTGALYINHEYGLTNKDPRVDVTVNPSVNRFDVSGVTVQDKNGVTIGTFSGIHKKDGTVGFNIGAQRDVNGSTIYNTINVMIDASGNRTVAVSNAEPWRTALKVLPYNNSVSTSGVGCYGYLTSSRKQISFMVPYPLFSGTDFTISSLKLVVRHIVGTNYAYVRSGTNGATYTQLGSGETSVIANGEAVRSNEIASTKVWVHPGSGIEIGVTFNYEVCSDNSGTVLPNNTPLAVAATLTGTIS